jgi:hypothetical protein
MQSAHSGLGLDTLFLLLLGVVVVVVVVSLFLLVIIVCFNSEIFHNILKKGTHRSFSLVVVFSWRRFIDLQHMFINLNAKDLLLLLLLLAAGASCELRQ